MNIELMLKAQEEAERFIESVQELLEHRATNTDWQGKFHLSDAPFIYGKHSATVKRRSMDLTRSLSKMRQG